MTETNLPPIPNEAALIRALRVRWNEIAATAAYRRGIIVRVAIINGRNKRHVAVTAETGGEFEETYSATG